MGLTCPTRPLGLSMSLSPSRDPEGNNVATNIKKAKTAETSFYQVQSNSSDHEVSFKCHHTARVSLRCRQFDSSQLLHFPRFHQESRVVSHQTIRTAIDAAVTHFPQQCVVLCTKLNTQRIRIDNSR